MTLGAASARPSEYSLRTRAAVRGGSAPSSRSTSASSSSTICADALFSRVAMRRASAIVRTASIKNGVTSISDRKRPSLTADRIAAQLGAAPSSASIRPRSSPASASAKRARMSGASKARANMAWRTRVTPSAFNRPEASTRALRSDCGNPFSTRWVKGTLPRAVSGCAGSNSATVSASRRRASTAARSVADMRAVAEKLAWRTKSCRWASVSSDLRRPTRTGCAIPSGMS